MDSMNELKEWVRAIKEQSGVDLILTDESPHLLIERVGPLEHRLVRVSPAAPPSKWEFSVFFSGNKLANRMEEFCSRRLGDQRFVKQLIQQWMIDLVEPGTIAPIALDR